MANDKQERLFAQFPPVTTAQWEEVITADLKGADYQKKLVWRTAEGFNVRPYYRAEDLQGIAYLGRGCGEFPFVRGTECCNRWKVHQTVSAENAVRANDEARRAVEAGADSIGFRVGKDFRAADVPALLDGICPERTELVFYGCGVAGIVEAVMGLLEEKKADPEKAGVCFAIDPIIRKLSLKGAFECCEDGDKCFEEIAGFVKRYEKFRRVRFVGVTGQTFGDSGSTIVQELAFALAAGHEYLVRLMQAGLTVDQAARTIRFSVSVSSNYFMEIAKLRAGRILWANIVKAYDPKCDCSEKWFVHAVTSGWNITVYDPYVNMLRGTTEAMSASIAGAHSLEVRPFDSAYEAPTEFSSRIARNVQLLLKNESHFDSVVDPAGGSYYIENLTRSITDQAWKLFKAVEEKGGYVAAFKEGFIPDAVSESAAAKDKNVATRRITLLGTNQFPGFNEVAPEQITEQTVSGKSCCCGRAPQEGAKVLRPYRGAQAFERMRLRVDRSGKTPKAFMLTVASLAMARARAQFASNFFACAGIRIQDNTFFHSVEEGVEAALKSGAEIGVLCAADDDYAALAPRVKELLGERAILVVAGAPASQPELEAQGITNFISVRSNVLETLKGYLAKLGI